MRYFMRYVMIADVCVDLNSSQPPVTTTFETCARPQNHARPRVRPSGLGTTRGGLRQSCGPPRDVGQTGRTPDGRRRAETVIGGSSALFRVLVGVGERVLAFSGFGIGVMNNLFERKTGTWRSLN